MWHHPSVLLRPAAPLPLARFRPAPSAVSPFRSSLPSRSLSLARPAPTASAKAGRFGLYSLVALGLSSTYWTYTRPALSCASPLDGLKPGPKPEVGGGDPRSEFSAYELSFGAVCGICSGVFIKKGLRAIAFMLGGVFILLQYLSSKSFISIDWGKVAGRYDSAFGTKTSDGKIRAPSVGGVWAWFVDFLTANFQQRASFLAGLVLGLRLG